MRHFDEILQLAGQHHGSAKTVLKQALDNPHAADLKSVPDDRYLAQMTQAVFNAGFSWKVIQAKWAGFETAFEGFNPNRVGFYADEEMHRLLADTGIVRNGQKIKATIENARFVTETAKVHGSFGQFLDEWPADDQVGMLTYLSKGGSRLGGATAQYFLRFSGYDAWIASKDVCAALVRQGVLDKPTATSKTALNKLQEAINTLHDQSGQPRAVISKVLAKSVG